MGNPKIHIHVDFHENRTVQILGNFIFVRKSAFFGLFLQFFGQNGNLMEVIWYMFGIIGKVRTLRIFWYKYEPPSSIRARSNGKTMSLQFQYRDMAGGYD